MFIYLPKYVIKKYQAGIAMPVVIIVIVVLIGLGVGGYFMLRQRGGDTTTPSSPTTQPKIIKSGGQETMTLPFLGGWRVEKVFGLDARGQWSETVKPPHKPTYIEFDISSSCITEATDLKCKSYLAGYEVDGDIISFPGATGSRLKWRIIGEKLELINEDHVGNSWSPSIKFTSVKVK